MKTQVLIVGAGPTGLMAANQLARFGIDFIIIDSKKGPTHESRAIAVTPRSLELYQQMGLIDYVLKNGKKMTVFNLYSEGQRRAEVPIGEIGVGMCEFPYLFSFEQSKNEQLLAQTLKKKKAKLLWQTEFIELGEHTNGINAVAQKKGKVINIEADYLIGCDGARSPVRHQLDFNFKGGTYENRFFVADVVMNWQLPYDRVLVAPGRKTFSAFMPMGGDRRYRAIGTLPLRFSDVEEIKFDDISDDLIRNMGMPLDFEKVNWVSTYKLHHRCVDRFRDGRVFLAGDAAHIHSPAGGQGMNTGLQDAYNLAWKLTLVLKGKADQKLLDTYNEERLPFAKWLLNFTDQGFTFMSSANPFMAAFRKYFVFKLVGKIVKIKALQPRIFKTMSQIGFSYDFSSLSASNTGQKLQFSAGDRLPYLEVARKSLYLQFKAASFHYLHIGKRALGPATVKKIKQTLPFPVKIVESKASEDWRKLGVSQDLFVLVRPDNYIAHISDTFDAGALQEYVQNNF